MQARTHVVDACHDFMDASIRYFMQLGRTQVNMHVRSTEEEVG